VIKRLFLARFLVFFGVKKAFQNTKELKVGPNFRFCQFYYILRDNRHSDTDYLFPPARLLTPFFLLI
jgi:hypothetical protein